MRLRVAIACIWTLATGALAQEAAVLETDEVLTAAFRQERYLEGFSGAAVSNGQFYLVPDKGVLWATLKPFENQLVVGRRGITQLVKGKKTLRIPASKMPGAQTLQAVFTDIMRGDWDRLERELGVKRSFHGDIWTLSFDPDRRGGGAGVQTITLKGKAYVETIQILRDNGDKDHIFLSDHEIRSVEQLRNIVRIIK